MSDPVHNEKSDGGTNNEDVGVNSTSFLCVHSLLQDLISGAVQTIQSPSKLLPKSNESNESNESNDIDDIEVSCDDNDVFSTQDVA